MSNETESILDLQIEVIQASIYCDIIKRLLLQHRSVSIVKVIVFSFIIKKQQYLQKNIYTGRNRDGSDVWSAFDSDGIERASGKEN